jgi:hypothetical protein
MLNYFSSICQDLIAGDKGLIIFLSLDIYQIDQGRLTMAGSTLKPIDPPRHFKKDGKWRICSCKKASVLLFLSAGLSGAKILFSRRLAKCCNH